MISRILTTLLCMITASPVFAAHIQAFDTATIYDLYSMANVSRSTGKWVSSGGDSSFMEVSDTQMDASIERNILNSYVMAASNNATLTMNFGTNVVANNIPGYDLALFTLDPLTTPDLEILAPTVLKVTAGGISLNYQSTPIIFDGLLEGVFNADKQLLGALGVIMIDLDDFLPTGVPADEFWISEFSINALTAAENPEHFPTITAAGAFKTTVVPLPLPIVLFASGLAFLGFIGRRKR